VLIESRVRVIYSNLGPILHRFWDMAQLIGWKSQICSTLCHLAPSLGVTLFEFMVKLYWSWN